MKDGQQELLSFGGHLEVLRRMLFRIIAVAGLIAVLVFCFKEQTFAMLLAPSRWARPSLAPSRATCMTSARTWSA